MKCPNCGTENEDKRIFCSICGVSLKDAAAEPAAEPPARDASPRDSGKKRGGDGSRVAESGVSDDSASEDSAPKKNGKPFVLAAALAVLAAAAAYFFIPGFLQNRSVRLENSELRLSLDHPARWAETKNDAVGVDLKADDAVIKIRDVTEPVLKKTREGAELQEALEYAVTRYAGYDAAASAGESRRLLLKTGSGIFADYGFPIAGGQVSGTVRQHENRLITLSLEGAGQKSEETDYNAIAASLKAEQFDGTPLSEKINAALAAAKEEKEKIRLAEEKKREEEEARRLAEEKRRAEEEAQRLAEEKRREEDEARRLAEEKRREEDEARRLAEEERLRREEEERRLAEEERLRKEEEENRRAGLTSIELYNDFDFNLRISVVYYYDEAKDWRTRGWYVIKPGGSKTLNYTSSNPNVYVHSYGSGTDKFFGKSDLLRTVISDEFDYTGESENCPQGSQRRSGRFTKFTAKNGVVTYYPTASDATKSTIVFKVRNDFDSNVNVAVVSYNVSEEDWQVDGWWQVKPGQERELTFSKNDGSNFYVHAKLVGGKVLTTKGDMEQTVRSSEFGYFARDGLKEGENLRAAKFEKLPVKDGAASLTLGP